MCCWEISRRAWDGACLSKIRTHTLTPHCVHPGKLVNGHVCGTINNSVSTALHVCGNALWLDRENIVTTLGHLQLDMVNGWLIAYAEDLSDIHAGV